MPRPIPLCVTVPLYEAKPARGVWVRRFSCKVATGRGDAILPIGEYRQPGHRYADRRLPALSGVQTARVAE